MTITSKQIRFLRQKAHHLKPVVLTGAAGLTDAVLEEIERALEDHELIKVKISAEEREQRTQFIDEICSSTNAILVQSIGHIGVFYRKKKKPVLVLPT